MAVITAILVTSLVLQFIAVYFALRLIRITGRSLAWSFLAGAIVLMAMRRGISLGQLIDPGSHTQPSLAAELIALAISAMMALGIERITPIFAGLHAFSDKLKENENRYRLLFENSPIAIWEEDFSHVKTLLDDLHRSSTEDFDTYLRSHPDIVRQCAALVRIVEVNQAALSLHGASSKQELLEGLENTFTPESFDAFREALLSLWSGDTEMQRDAMVRTLAGERRHVTVNFSVCPGHERTLDKVFVSLTDITERTLMEQALRQKEHQFRTLVEHSPDPVVRYDTELHRIYVNPAWERASGLSRDEVVNVSVEKIPKVPQPVIPDYLEALERALERGTREAVDFTWVNARGEELNLQFVVLPEFDQEGKVISLLSVGRDITPLRQAERGHQAHMAFLANMDRINRAIQGRDDLDQMMRDVLDEILEIFDCDRAFLIYPCDPRAASWSAPMERTRPDYPGIGALGIAMPMEPWIAEKMERLLESQGVVTYGRDSTPKIPVDIVERLGIRSIMSTALYPKQGKPWEFGILQSAYDRTWSEDDERLLLEIGRRLSDGLSSLLVLRDLRKNEEKYRRIFDTASEGIWGQDEHFKTTFVNAHMAEMLEYPVEELLGRHVTDFMYDEDREDHRNRIGGRQTGVAEVYERRFRKKSGETLWTLVSATPVFEAERFSGSFAMVTDISTRKASELQLKESVELTESVINAIPDILYEVDIEGRYLNVWTRNPEMLALPKDVLIGKTVHDVLSPEAAAIAMAGIREADAEGFSFGSILRIDLPHGPHWFEQSLTKKTGDDPTAEARFIVLSRDVTERKRMEDTLRMREQYSQSLLRLTRRLEQSQNTSEAVAAAQEEVLGMIGFSFLAVYLLSDDKSRFDMLASSGGLSEGIKQVSARLPIAGDPMLEEIAVSDHIVVVEDARTDPRTDKAIVDRLGLRTIVNVPVFLSDRHLGAISTGTYGEQAAHKLTQAEEEYLTAVASHMAVTLDRMRLLSERQRAEENLRRYKDHLEQTVEQRTEELRFARDAAEAANRAKSIFLANMSHELRTPLNAILGFSHLMRQDPTLNESQHENLDIINHSGEHLLKLINDVLEIAKIEAGKVQLDISGFDLHLLVRDVADMMRLRAQQKGLQLDLDQESDFPRYIRGDEARMRQILVNLVGNAVKFTEQGGIQIRLVVEHADADHLVIEVEDSGPGISKANQALLFRPFVQLSEGASRGGTGLGLSIVHQFVELMGGHIDVESTPGKGSLFRVELPLETASAQEAISSGSFDEIEVTGLAPGQSAYRILIAEDQQDNQRLLARLMNDIGLEARIAGDGVECIRLFEQWHPDLILMDWRMPLMDGVEATQRIRHLPGGRQVKIVAVTASAFKEEQPELVAAGMDGYVRKPFRFSDIYGELKRQLGLEFTYRSSARPTVKSLRLLTSENLGHLSDELLMELRDAVESLDSDRIAAIIERIGSIDADLGISLTHLADDFDYPKILRSLNGVTREDAEP